MELKRIGALSAGKVLGVLSALTSLIVGLLFLPFTAFMAWVTRDSPYGFSTLPMVFGVGAIIVAPIFSAVIGFIAGAIGAAFYNLIARLVGGLELEFEERTT